MKKILILALATIMVVTLCISASADVVNSNHYIEPAYKNKDDVTVGRFNADESEWDIYGWSVVDTEIVRLGYKLDGTTVWVIESNAIDVRDKEENVKPNDCFIDNTLHEAVAKGGMANGLENFFAYRIHITLDTTKMEKGEHTFNVKAEYKDGSTGNPFRKEKYTITKTVDAIVSDESSDVEESNETVDTNETADTNETDGSSEAEVSSEPEESKDPDETKDEQSSEPDESKDPDETKDEDGSSEPEESKDPDETEKTVDPSDIKRGDCNKDGEVDNKDIVTLFRYVSGNEKEEDETIYDYDQDGEVNNKDVTSLFRAVSTLQ